jgi:hypothetical protein
VRPGSGIVLSSSRRARGQPTCGDRGHERQDRCQTGDEGRDELSEPGQLLRQG